MFDLCIVQAGVREYPHNGPLLRIAPASSEQLAFTHPRPVADIGYVCFEGVRQTPTLMTDGFCLG